MITNHSCSHCSKKCRTLVSSHQDAGDNWTYWELSSCCPHFHFHFFSLIIPVRCGVKASLWAEYLIMCYPLSIQSTQGSIQLHKLTMWQCYTWYHTLLTTDSLSIFRTKALLNEISAAAQHRMWRCWAEMRMGTSSDNLGFQFQFANLRRPGELLPAATFSQEVLWSPGWG